LNAFSKRKKEKTVMKFWKDKEFLKKVLLLSLPIALQNLITSILNIFDQLMVGWLPSNADNCLSAVLLANQIVFIYQIVLFAASNTANIFIAQYAENGKKDKIPSSVGFLLIVCAAVCAVFTSVCLFAPDFVIGLFSPQEEYAALASEFLSLVAWSFIPMCFSVALNFTMRGIKRMRVGLITNIIAVVCNIFLNYFFMFGLFGYEGMGFLGAAYGTIVSRIIEFALMLGGVILFRYPLFARPKEMFSFARPFVKQFFKMFFPILCNEIFWVLSSTVYLYVYDKLPSSEIALAAMNIAQSVDKIVSVAMIGIGSAVGIIIGNVIGEGDREKVDDYANKSLWFALFTGLLIGILTVGCAFVAPNFFANVSLEAKETAKVLLLLFALTAVLRTVGFMAVIGILRSGGDTTFCMVSETLCIWLVSVPLVFFGGLVKQWNIYILYLLANVSEIIKCIFFVLRAKSNKWLKFVDQAEPSSAPLSQEKAALSEEN